MERDFNWLWETLREGARQEFEESCYDVYKVEVIQGNRGKYIVHISF